MEESVLSGTKIWGSTDGWLLEIMSMTKTAQARSREIKPEDRIQRKAIFSGPSKETKKRSLKTWLEYQEKEAPRVKRE